MGTHTDLNQILKDENVTWKINSLEIEKVSNTEQFYQSWNKAKYEQMPSFSHLHMESIYVQYTWLHCWFPNSR